MKGFREKDRFTDWEEFGDLPVSRSEFIVEPEEEARDGGPGSPPADHIEMFLRKGRSGGFEVPEDFKVACNDLYDLHPQPKKNWTGMAMEGRYRHHAGGGWMRRILAAAGAAMRWATGVLAGRRR